MQHKLLGVAAIVVLLAAVSFWALKEPRSDREWNPEVDRITTIETQENGEVLVRNVRDWTYSADTVLTNEWIDMTINPDEVVQVWFLVEPFEATGTFGHTFLSFEFDDGRTLSVSVEARKEVGEEYSELGGIFRKYELAYVWGTERDFLIRRSLYLKHELRMYPLELEEKIEKKLLRIFLEDTNELAAKPAFYNTLTHNCTSVLAHVVNGHAPGTLPIDPSWIFTAQADKYLMRQGFIEERNSTTVLNPILEKLSPQLDALTFSREVRTGVLNSAPE